MKELIKRFSLVCSWLCEYAVVASYISSWESFPTGIKKPHTARIIITPHTVGYATRSPRRRRPRYYDARSRSETTVPTGFTASVVDSRDRAGLKRPYVVKCKCLIYLPQLGGECKTCCPHPQPLSQKGRCPHPQPLSQKGRCPHPQPLSQMGRGEDGRVFCMLRS